MRNRLATVALHVALLSLPARADLIGYYNFDGNANDSTVHGNNGTLSPNAPTLTAVGGGYTGWGNLNSQAFLFGAGSTPSDPLNSFITVPIDINPTVLPQVTFGAWIKANDLSPVIRGIISHDNGNFDRTLDSDTRFDGQARITAFTGAGAGNGIAGALLTTDWTFVALRYDATTGQGQMTINGGSSAPYTVANGAGLNITYIGRNPGFDLPFVGLIDDVFFYDTYLSNAQMHDLYLNGPVPEPSTLLMLVGGVGILFLRRRCQ